jgi:hypothetical protein
MCSGSMAQDMVRRRGSREYGFLRRDEFFFGSPFYADNVDSIFLHNVSILLLY